MLCTSKPPLFDFCPLPGGVLNAGKGVGDGRGCENMTPPEFNVREVSCLYEILTQQG